MHFGNGDMENVAIPIMPVAGLESVTSCYTATALNHTASWGLNPQPNCQTCSPTAATCLTQMTSWVDLWQWFHLFPNYNGPYSVTLMVVCECFSGDRPARGKAEGGSSVADIPHSSSAESIHLRSLLQAPSNQPRYNSPDCDRRKRAMTCSQTFSKGCLTPPPGPSVNPARGYGEWCKPPQWGPGQSPCDIRIFVHFELENSIWWWHCWLFYAVLPGSVWWRWLSQSHRTLLDYRCLRANAQARNFVCVDRHVQLLQVALTDF